MLNTDSEEIGFAAGEQVAEIWLCWDNEQRTLTKIGNKRVLLARGLAPTPDGLDPYFGVKAVSVPGRVYGDSILNWIGGLCVEQTVLKRGRSDEVKLNVWQQGWYELGSITQPQMLQTPGGMVGIQA